MIKTLGLFAHIFTFYFASFAQEPPTGDPLPDPDHARNAEVCESDPGDKPFDPVCCPGSFDLLWT